MSKHGTCPICGGEVNHSDQVTCGAPDCVKTLRAQRRAEKGGSSAEPEEFVEHSDNLMRIGFMSKEPIRNDADLCRIRNVDTNVWRVKTWKATHWTTTMKGADGEPYQVENPYISATFERKVKALAVQEEIEKLKDFALSEFPSINSTVVVDTPRSGYLLELSPQDVHFGKLAWDEETRGGNYDTEIAEKRFSESVDDLIGKASHYPAQKILFVTGSDVLHTDNRAGTTTSGTPQDIDSRYENVFEKTFRRHVEAIEKARRIAPVRVVVVRGNHSYLGEWHLGFALDCLYKGCKDVTIDRKPSDRKYYRWGDVLLGFTHGDSLPWKKMAAQMMSEARRTFGQVNHFEIHTADKHHERVVEEFGVTQRILSALCASDAWHSKKGYTGNQERATGFVWHKTYGLQVMLFGKSYTHYKEVA